MSTTATMMRSWQGPAVLSFGFRPFFLGAAFWALAVMILWIIVLLGAIDLPTRFDPVSWHAHEFLFGYLAAPVAGFLLTAVPNWTGRLPIVGWPLLGLVLLWVAGRLAVLFSALLPVWFVAAVDLSMPLVLSAVIAREIIVGKNWRNLIVLSMIGVFALSNAIFHWEVARGDYAAQGYGLRLGLGAAIMMIAVIGGRIVPSFTRNWLARQGEGRLPVPPMQRFDKLALLSLLAALLMWVVAPHSVFTGWLLVLAGLLHIGRLARWAGERTLQEPLVWVLHLGYAFVPLGALAVAADILVFQTVGAGTAQHLWMAGGVGMMTLAVMTRATLGHTGQSLTAGWGTTAIYLAALAAVLARVVAGFVPAMAPLLHNASGLAWMAAFALFLALYGPLLLVTRR